MKVKMEEETNIKLTAELVTGRTGEGAPDLVVVANNSDLAKS